VKELREIGIQPDLLLCRSEHFLSPEIKDKIALFCDVDVENVINARDVESVYAVPLGFAEQGVDERILQLFRLEAGPRHMEQWTAMLDRLRHPAGEVSIGLVGKYTRYEDAYKSLKEALLHGGLAHELKVDIHWIDAEGVVGEGWEKQLEGYDGILVPGGFGKRGIDGMLNAIRYARERKVPYFGICLGMQTLVIEYARNVCGLAGADSTEFNSGTPHRVIFKLRELKGVDELGGTMRLGGWPCRLAEDSFDPAKVVVLETAPKAGLPAPVTGNPGTARITRYETSRVTVETNAVADAINEHELDKLGGGARTYTGEMTGNFAIEDKKLPSPLNLSLKVGAQRGRVGVAVVGPFGEHFHDRALEVVGDRLGKASRFDKNQLHFLIILPGRTFNKPHVNRNPKS